MPSDLDPSLRKKYDRDYLAGPSEWLSVGSAGKAENVLTLCASIPHSSVVEIGAGEGAVLKRLQDQGFADEACAVEISEHAAQLIRDRSIPRLAEVKVYDGGTIPYPDSRFDLAILSHVVEHLEHPRKVLYEAGRIARYVLIEVPIEDTFRRRGDFAPDVTGHINFYSPKSIRWLLQTCGFRVLREIVTNPPRATYRYLAGWRGVVDHTLKEILLRSVPPLAPYLTWRYMCTLVCESPTKLGPGAMHLNLAPSREPVGSATDPSPSSRRSS